MAGVSPPDGSEMLVTILTAIALGAIIGSFLNVCIHRLPRGESLVWPGSRCPACHRPIAWYDNVPLASYLVLAGRCRRCGAAIPWRYPAVEAANAAGYAVIVWWYGPGWAAVAYGALFSALLVVTAIDLVHYLIPDAITLPGIAVGLLSAATVLPIRLLDAGLGVLLGGGILWALAWMSPYVFGKEGMGGGDIKLLAMIGAFLGWKATLLTIMLSAITGSIVGLALMGFGLLQRGQYLPFGPFLALGAVLALFFHEDLIGWYMGLLTAAR